jgi:uncharacterized protein YcgL (UPF0745 family)
MLLDNDCQITKWEKKMVLYIYIKKKYSLKALPCFEVPRHEGGSPSDGLFLLENLKIKKKKK